MDPRHRPWADFIASRRRELGLTQEAVAERIGVRQSVVSRWERGAIVPPTAVHGRLVRALSITPDELYALTTAETEPTEAAS